MGTLTSAQFQQILEANSKSIEIYLEVNNQYESIIELLEDLKKSSSSHFSNDEVVKKTFDILSRLEAKMKEDHTSLDGMNKNICNKLTDVEKNITRQNVILSGTVTSIVLAIIAKILGFDF